MHSGDRRIWTETVACDLPEGKEYTLFDVEPGVEVRIQYVDGELIDKTRTRSELHIIKGSTAFAVSALDYHERGYSAVLLSP